jgi:hypothetical protein
MDKIEPTTYIIGIIENEIRELDIVIEHFISTKNNRRYIETFNQRQLLVRLLRQINEM